MKKSHTNILVLMLFGLNVQASVINIKDSLRTKKDDVKVYQSSTMLKRYFANLTTNNSQDTSSKKQAFTNLQFSGYVRPYVQYRVMNVIRPGMIANSKQDLSVNGYQISNQQAAGYQEPLLLLRLEGKPTRKTSFKIEYAFDNQLDGISQTFNNTPLNGITAPYSRRVSIYRILQFQGSTVTKYGVFNVIAGGGVNWYRLSPLTLWNYEYRDDMFERYPWEPENKSFNRYNSFYSVQNVPRDARWGNTGTQGFIIEAKALPLGFNAVLLYGKTDNSGGFQTYVSQTPKNMLSGRLDREIGTHKIGVNYFSQFGYFDGSAQYKIDQNIATLDAQLNFPHLKVFAEFGAGQYVESGILSSTNYYSYFGKATSGDTIASYKNKWAPTGSLQIDFDKHATLIPLNFQVYYIDKSVVNVNSSVLNTANNHAQGSPSNVNSASDITTIKGAITDIGQMANNRMGVSLKHENSYGKLKIMVAMNVTQEIENLYKVYSSGDYNIPNNTASYSGYAQSFNSISFQHRANQFTRSRFGYYQNNLGPYNRVINLYRRSFETIAITDTGDFAKSYRKGFNTIDFNWKYKVSLFKKDLIVSNYYNYTSVQDHFSLVPLSTDKAFLRYFYTEFNAFYAVHQKVSVLAFFSIERALGNNRTALADSSGNLITDSNTNIPIYNATGKGIDQTGHGYGIGIDYDFAPRAGLYFRHRWFDHKDKNFTKDHFYGAETSIEFKVFF